MKANNFSCDGPLPLVSVIIPCYNARNYIEEAVSSAFNQDSLTNEVIVVDDGSTDGSFELLLDLKACRFPSLRVLHHPDRRNCGVSETRFLGFVNAQGTYIALLDADDVHHPSKTKAQLELLRCNAETVLCHSRPYIISEHGHPAKLDEMFSIHPTHKAYWYQRRPDLFVRNGICTSSVLVKKEAILSIPRIHSQLFQFEDWCMWTLLSQKGKFICTEEALVGYRYHNTSSTHSIVTNLTKAIYSRLEFICTIAALSSNPFLRLRALVWGYRTIHTLARHYLRSSKASSRASNIAYD